MKRETVTVLLNPAGHSFIIHSRFQNTTNDMTVSQTIVWTDRLLPLEWLTGAVRMAVRVTVAMSVTAATASVRVTVLSSERKDADQIDDEADNGNRK